MKILMERVELVDLCKFEKQRFKEGVKFRAGSPDSALKTFNFSQKNLIFEAKIQIFNSQQVLLAPKSRIPCQQWSHMATKSQK